METRATNPYMNVELSTDTESEAEEIVKVQPEKREREARPKKQEAKVVKSARIKKNEAVIKSVKLIRQKMNIFDFSAVQDEFTRLLNEIGKLQRTSEGEGTPLIFLQILDHMNDVVVLNKDKNDFKKKKDVLKQILQLKKSVGATFQTYEDEIVEAKKSPDFYKEENEEEEAETEAAQAAKAPTEEAAQNNEAPKDETEDEDEVEEMDFSKRLTLSREDRRKFWLLKTKHKKEKDGPKKPETRKIKERKEKTDIDNKFVAEEEEFKSFDISQKSLQKKIKDFYDRKLNFKEDELAYNLRFLEFIIDQVTSEKTRAEILILMLNFELELMKMQGIVTIDLWSDSVRNIKRLFKSISTKNLKLTNYIKGEDVDLEQKDLIRYFNGFINQLNSEIMYALKLIDPFHEEFAIRLLQEIEFVEFLFVVFKHFRDNTGKDEEKPENNNEDGEAEDNTKATQLRYNTELAFRIIEHIYHISNDCVLNCEKLSTLFEDEEIDKQVEKLATYIYENQRENKLTITTKLYHSYCITINRRNGLALAKQLLFEALETGTLKRDRYLTALFNRGIAALGTSNFKAGNYLECKLFLYDIVNSDNMEALLYQYNPKNTNVLEFTDPLSIFPYYMHINLEEVEIAFLLASIVTESHQTVNFQDSLQKSTANKKLIKFIENYQKNVFVNSLNNVRDRIFICYRKIIQYDYLEAFRAAEKIKYFDEVEGYKENISRQIKLEAFNCYIEKLKAEDKSALNIDDLASLFDIERSELVAYLGAKGAPASLNSRVDEGASLLTVDNSISGFFKTEEDYHLLEKLKAFYELNRRRNLLENGEENSKAIDAHEIYNFVHRNFENKERFFNFNYDYAFFKKSVG